MAKRTVFIAKLIGLYCIVYALAMFAHKQATVEAVNGLVHSPPALLILGVMTLAAGLALVLGHNVWSGGALTIVVTVIGWLALLKGLVFVLLPPDATIAYMAALNYEQLFYAYAAVTLLIGAYLTYAGFKPAA